MEVTGTQSWVETARSAARLLRADSASKTHLPAEFEFPEIIPAPTGLRGLEETQSQETLESKGLVVNYYI